MGTIEISGKLHALVETIVSGEFGQGCIFHKGFPGLGEFSRRVSRESSKDETGGYELDIGVAKEFKALVGFLGLGGGGGGGGG